MPTVKRTPTTQETLDKRLRIILLTLDRMSMENALWWFIHHCPENDTHRREVLEAITAKRLASSRYDPAKGYDPLKMTVGLG